MEILIGALISVITEVAKRYFETNRLWTILFFLAISFFAGGLYVYLQGTEYLDTLIKIAGTSALVYGVIINSWNKRSE